MPLPDDLRFLGIRPNLRSLRLTHAQPTPEMLDGLAEVCPDLEELSCSAFSKSVTIWFLIFMVRALIQ